jgi:opacity protein-like surface antigen
VRHASLSLSFLLLASQAQAYQLDPYLALGMGIVFPGQDITIDANSSYDLYNGTSLGTSIFQLPLVRWQNDLQTGFENNLIVGIHLPHQWRIEGEFLYQNMDRDIDGSYSWEERNSATGALAFSATDRPLADSSANASVFALMSNLLYDFKNTSKYTPYFGAGIGIGWIDSSGSNHSNELVTQTSGTQSVTPTTEYAPDLYGTAFAWQAKLGVNIDWKDNKSFDISYRAFGTSQFQQKNGKIVTNPDNDNYTAVFYIPKGDINGLLDHSIFVNFKYTFK